MREYRFDLHAWFAGEVRSSPAAVLAMLRHLPEGSVFKAKMSALAESARNELQRRKDAGEDVELPEESEPDELDRLYQEKLTWTTVPTLLATLINRTTDGVRVQLDPKSRPNWPVVGPEAWWPEEQKKTNEPDQVDSMEGVTPSLLTRHFGMMMGG